MWGPGSCGGILQGIQGTQSGAQGTHPVCQGIRGLQWDDAARGNRLKSGFPVGGAGHGASSGCMEHLDPLYFIITESPPVHCQLEKSHHHDLTLSRFICVWHHNLLHVPPAFLYLVVFAVKGLGLLCSPPPTNRTSPCHLHATFMQPRSQSPCSSSIPSHLARNPSAASVLLLGRLPSLDPLLRASCSHCGVNWGPWLLSIAPSQHPRSKIPGLIRITYTDRHYPGKEVKAISDGSHSWKASVKFWKPLSRKLSVIRFTAASGFLFYNDDIIQADNNTPDYCPP
ncbi:hypothetical protein G7046_g2091 [Stylonectria norvegica]|nr:hypothetical protein G7046_g2091 [Stylonectria norvegica]